VAERALDIFALLSQIDKKNYQIWDSLTEAQQKEFSPLIVMRWMSGTSDPFQIIMLNEVVNPYVFELNKELLLKLLGVCSNGKQKRYSWVNLKTVGKKQKTAVELIEQYYEMTTREALDVLPMFSSEELMELAEELGLQKDELKNFKKELG